MQKKRRALKILRNVLILILILGIIGTGSGIWFMANKMITPRKRSVSEWHQKILAAPADYGLQLEPFTAHSSDGTTLSALLVSPAKKHGVAKKRRAMEQRLQKGGFHTNHRGLVLLIHGRSGIKEDALPITERFVAAGFSCVLFDGRAHGQSGGRFCTYGHHEVDDALTVLAAAKSAAGFDESVPVFGFGYSLGAAVMVQTLAKAEPIRAATVVAPFADLEDLVLFSGGKFSANYLPDWMARSVVRLGEFRAGFQAQNIQPLAAASAISEPMMIVHGSLDRVIPISHGKRIFEAIPHTSKTWREVEWGYHGNVLAEGGDDLYEEIIRFYLQNLKTPPNDTQSTGTARFSKLKSPPLRKLFLNERKRHG